jgi:hypothetical protein
MSWLIESYLEEGKHGPDHPRSLNMYDSDSMVKKHEKINDRKEDYSKYDNDTNRIDRKEANWHVSKCGEYSEGKGAKLYRSKEADIAGKKGMIHGKRYEDAKDDYVVRTLTKTDKNENAKNKLNKINPEKSSSVSTIKSIRRHDEKKTTNECAWIVELMQ